jgi:hypothetical protein
MSDDDVFSRRWDLTEDELLWLLWRCHAGENPDVVLLELYVQHGKQPRPRRRVRRVRRVPKVTRHLRPERRVET